LADSCYYLGYYSGYYLELLLAGSLLAGAAMATAVTGAAITGLSQLAVRADAGLRHGAPEKAVAGARDSGIRL
jgi:hypothetical protein